MARLTRGANAQPQQGAAAPPANRPAFNPARMARGDYPMYQAEQPGVGNKSIALKNCYNVVFRDFSILKGGHFGFLLTGVDNVTIDNIKIDTDRDGIDIDCCQNVRVSNCTVNSPWDDGICPKSSYALGYARATRNVTIANNFVSGWYQLGSVLDGSWKKFPADRRAFGTGRIKCGTESNGGFINMTITGNVFEGCLGYALESVDGALLEDVTISNTTMRDLGCGPLFLRLGVAAPRPKGHHQSRHAQARSHHRTSSATTRPCARARSCPGFRTIQLKISSSRTSTSRPSAAAQPKWRKSRLPNGEDNYPEPGRFGPMPSSGFFLRHIRNLEMSHVEIANAIADARPAFSLYGVERADFFAITAPRNAGGAFALHNVKDLRIGWSRAAADATLDTVDNKLL